MRLLFAINGKNLHKLSQEVDMTTSHLSNVMDQWSREGIIEKEKKGRETEIKTTEIGKKVIGILREYEKIATEQLRKVKEINN